MWKFFKSDGSEKKTVMGPFPSRVTPTQFAALTPVDGDEVILIADATAGVYWHLKYNAGSASAYKWEFIGGSELYSEVTTGEATGSGSYVALTTPGPTITLPRAGDYIVDIGGVAYQVGGGSDPYMSYDIGATTAVDSDAIRAQGSNVLSGPPSEGANARKRLKAGLTAVALTSKYKGSGSAGWYNRWMAVRPIRLS